MMQETWNDIAGFPGYQAPIAALYGIRKQTVSGIKCGVSWSWLTGMGVE